MKKIFGLILMVCLIAALPMLGVGEALDEGKIIDKIEFTGLQYHNPDELFSQIQTREKTPFSRNTLDQDVQRLNATGFFADIKWDVVRLDNGAVKIIFYLTENELIEQIHFEGFKNINPETINNQLKLKVGGSFNEFYVATDLRMIRDAYLKDGYCFVEVNYRRVKGLRGALIVYSVREGPKVLIDEIKIVGNKSFPKTYTFLIFPNDPVKDQMGSKSGGVYDESGLMNDLVRIQNFYRDEGWFNTIAYIEDVSFNEAKTSVIVTIHIDEGVRYYVRKLELTGNTSITAEELIKNFKTKVGSPYRFNDISLDVQSIKKHYGKLGQIDCDIEPLLDYPKLQHLNEGDVNVTLKIQEGTKKYLEKINIVGNTKTKDKVIRRELKIYPGDLMDYDKMETSRDQVNATMFFKMTRYEVEDGSAPDNKNLLFRVEEERTGNVQIGGGFNSNTGFGGMLALSQNNFDIARLPLSFSDFFTTNSFAGAGQRFSIAWQPGYKLSSFSINFTEPYLYDKPLQLDLDFTTYKRVWENYDEGRSGEGVGLTRRFNSGLILGLGARIQNISIGNLAATTPSIIRELEGSNRLVAMHTSVGLDKRDNWLFTTRGFRFNTDFGYTGGFLGGNFNFTKTVTFAELYTPVVPNQQKLIFNMRGTLGNINKFGDTTSVPFFERFYAGGVDTVRGFQYRTISPKAVEDNSPIGGEILNVFNLELTYLVYPHDTIERPRDSVRFVTFFDAGNVVNRFSDLNWGDYRTSVGCGFNFYLSAMPIKIYAGYPIHRQPGDQRETIQLFIGYMY